MADFSTPSNLAARFLDAARLRENHICRAAQKDLRGEAREKSPSGGVLNQYVGARRLSATKHMSLFQQPAG
jgi:hypothetical protein